jgi:rubrerythrin
VSELAKKYQEARTMAEKFETAPRTGWVKPGSRARDNQAITVCRTEAVKLANDLASARYSSYFRLYENLALRNYMSQLAESEPGAVECEKCRTFFLTEWMDGKCPYCAAEDAATEEVHRMLEGGGGAAHKSD